MITLVIKSVPYNDIGQVVITYMYVSFPKCVIILVINDIPFKDDGEVNKVHDMSG